MDISKTQFCSMPNQILYQTKERVVFLLHRLPHCNSGKD